MKLGILDSSPGNGHMFSFSALFNGYEKSELTTCPFPAIIDYLPKYETPVQALSKLASVTDIWMPSNRYASRVARFAKIPNVHKNFETFLEAVDGIILTNDNPIGREGILDACIKTGKPVFVDKLLANSRSEFARIINSQHFLGQIFCASGAGFSRDFENLPWDDAVENAIISTPKSWDIYGIHVVDIFLKFAERNRIEYEIGELIREGDTAMRVIEVSGETNRNIVIKALGKVDSAISATIYSGSESRVATLTDPFFAFSEMLEHWLTRNVLQTYSDELVRYSVALKILGFDK